MSKSVYEIVTERICSELQKGNIPWEKMWGGCAGEDACINYVTRKPYSLINQMLLGGKAGEYLTYHQIQQLGGTVKEGEKPGFVVFYKQMQFKTREENKSDDEDNSEETETEKATYFKVPLLRYYNVYHIDQTEGIESKIKTGEETTEAVNPIEKGEEIIVNYLHREPHLKFVNNKPSNRAYFSPLQDLVQVPMLSQYKVPEAYYSTAFHEFTHSTLMPERCDRKDSLGRFGDETYSREELVAEIGASYLCAVSGIENTKTKQNSTAYIQSWLKALRNDSKMIVWAAGRAERATKYILGEVA